MPSSGRCRPNEYFIPSTTTRLFSAASPERNPVSVQCSLCLAWPNSHIPPAPPTSAATDVWERLWCRLPVFGLGEGLRLKPLSVTINPAVKPLSGTSHWVSENRSPAGAVQILRWSSTKRPTSPSPFPSDVFEAAFTSDGASVGVDDVGLSGPAFDAAGLAPSSCAGDRKST